MNNKIKNFLESPLNYEGINLYQIGKLFCNNRVEINSFDTPEFFRLTVVINGSGFFMKNDITAKIKRGDILLCSSKDNYAFENNGESIVELGILSFNCDIKQFETSLKNILDESDVNKCFTSRDDKISSLINSAVSEISSEKMYSKELLFSVIKQIIIFSIRSYGKTPTEDIINPENSPQILCDEIMNYIDNNIYSIQSLSELSSVMGYSYGYMSTVFKKTTNNTISNYYLDKRLNAAKQLILDNKLTVGEIAEMLNYTSAYSFSKAFTKHFGVSPRNYRNKKMV